MQKIKKYVPKPADTSDVRFPEGMEELMEIVAKNVHEVWAQGRMKDGWTYSEERDDIRKTHPCLVPYEQLSESEKDYDRNTAMQTIKLILKSGYKIEKTDK